MFPWGAIVAAAGTAVSGVMSAINNKKRQRAADDEAGRQISEQEARAYESALDRSENKEALAAYDRASKRQVETANNMGTIMGATPEFGLGVQKQVAEGRADLIGGMAAGASERRDKYLDKAEETRHAKAVADQERMLARNETYANLAANAASAVGSIVDAYSTPKAEVKTDDVGGPIKSQQKYVSVGQAPADANKEAAKARVING